MKRLAASIIAVLMTSVCTFAEGTFLRGGLNYSHFDPNDLCGYNGWYAGIGYQTYSRAGFSLQPELIFKVNGASFDDASSLRMNYIELPVNVQWGIDLLIAKPFLFVSPFLGYNFNNLATPADRWDSMTLNEAISDIDCGIGAGVGLNVWQLQFAAKYNWLFGKVVDWGMLKPSLADLQFQMATFEISIGFRL